MRIGVPAESRDGEYRVAATPETIKKLITAGHTVVVQNGAGVRASIPDADLIAAGATVAPDAEAVYASADLILRVRAPQDAELGWLEPRHILIGMLNRFDAAGLAALAARGVSAFALEAAPRISRAQSLDVLSSQANVAGYKAVLLAANAYGRLMPMLMTAAGTIKAARVVVMGVGVAGLQAIATAKRRGGGNRRAPRDQGAGGIPGRKIHRSAADRCRA